MNSRNKHHSKKKQLELQRRLREQDQQLMHQLQAPGTVSTIPLPASLGTTSESFDEKLRHARAWSPRSRRQMAAEALQWQAAIATVEAEEPAVSPILSVPVPIRRVARNSNNLRVPSNNYVPSQPIPSSSATLTAPLLVDRSPAEIGRTNYGKEDVYEPMDEDENESDQEDDYEGSSRYGLDLSGQMIKASR
jgi:hypothetical protein